MSNTVNLGKIFGIQFRLHFSWFIIFFVVTGFLAWQVFPGNLPDESQLAYWTMGAVTSLLFFASVLAHELAHSLAGRANGIPIKSITLFIFGGAAHMTREPRRASDELKMAIAGPISSLVIAGLFWVAWTSLSDTNEQLALMALWLAQINLILAAFNLFPGFPLDGGRLLRAGVWHFSGNYMRATRVATIAGRFVGYFFIGAGVVIIIAYQGWLAGIWLGFIGFFLESAARGSYRQVLLQQVLRGMSAKEVMIAGCHEVSGDTGAQQLAADNPDGEERCFLVTENGRATGILTSHNIESLTKGERESMLLKDIAMPLDKIVIAAPDDEVLGIVQQMNESSQDQVAVINRDGVVGIIELESLIKLVNLHPGFKR